MSDNWKIIFWSTGENKLRQQQYAWWITAITAWSTDVNDLATPRTRTAGLSSRSFSAAGRTVWNSLPSELKYTSLTIGHFTSQLKTRDICTQQLYVSAAIITFVIRLCAYKMLLLNWTKLATRVVLTSDQLTIKWLLTNWMGDCLPANKSSWYTTNHQGQLSLSPLVLRQNAFSCIERQATLFDLIRQVMQRQRSSEMGCH